MRLMQKNNHLQTQLDRGGGMKRSLMCPEEQKSNVFQEEDFINYSFKSLTNEFDSMFNQQEDSQNNTQNKIKILQEKIKKEKASILDND